MCSQSPAVTSVSLSAGRGCACQPDKAAKERISALEQQIHQLQLANKALAIDPFRNIIHGSAEHVYQAMPAGDRKVIPRISVQTVLETINEMAIRLIS